MQILIACAELESEKEAATRLGIAPGTLKNALTSAYAKLGVESRVGAYRELGWLRIPGRRERARERLADVVGVVADQLHRELREAHRLADRLERGG